MSQASATTTAAGASPALAALPISIFVVGMAACTLPLASWPGATVAVPPS